jgi:hypothetical protein
LYFSLNADRAPQLKAGVMPLLFSSRVSSMRMLSFSTFFLLLTITIAKTVIACDCVTLSPNESFQNADVVFEGEVVRISQVDQGTAYTFKVDKSLKGSAVSEVIVFEGTTNCDSHFWPDILYRVYVRKFQEKLTSGVCSGNEVLKTKTINPSKVGWQDFSPWQYWYVKTFVIIGVSLLICLLLWFLPRRSRHSAA